MGNGVQMGRKAVETRKRWEHFPPFCVFKSEKSLERGHDMKRFYGFLACFLMILSVFSVGCAPKKAEKTITDISFSEGKAYAAALETFWADGEYKYVFPSMMSGDCTVYYSDGTSENICAALWGGRATIKDLDRFDIFYYKQATGKRITHIGFSEGVDYPSALEVFWEDDEYEYVFGAVMAWDCTVYYSDGTSENLIDVLEGGRMTIAGLDEFGVNYYKERK